MLRIRRILAATSPEAATVSDHYMFELSLVKEKLQVAANAAEEEQPAQKNRIL